MPSKIVKAPKILIHKAKEDKSEKGVIRKQVKPVKIPSHLEKRWGCALPPTVLEK